MKMKSIDDVLSELGFSTKEKCCFKDCIQAVKDEQCDRLDNAELKIRKLTEEVIKE